MMKFVINFLIIISMGNLFVSAGKFSKLCAYAETVSLIALYLMLYHF